MNIVAVILRLRCAKLSRPAQGVGKALRKIEPVGEGVYTAESSATTVPSFGDARADSVLLSHDEARPFTVEAQLAQKAQLSCGDQMLKIAKLGKIALQLFDLLQTFAAVEAHDVEASATDGNAVSSGQTVVGQTRLWKRGMGRS